MPKDLEDLRNRHDPGVAHAWLQISHTTVWTIVISIIGSVWDKKGSFKDMCIKIDLHFTCDFTDGRQKRSRSKQNRFCF